MIIALLLSFVSGLLTHYTNSFVNRVSQPAWRSVSLYLIRITLKTPSLLWIGHTLKDDVKDPVKFLLIAHTLSAATYGMGMIAAWFINEPES